MQAQSIDVVVYSHCYLRMCDWTLQTLDLAAFFSYLWSHAHCNSQAQDLCFFWFLQVPSRIFPSMCTAYTILNEDGFVCTWFSKNDGTVDISRCNVELSLDRSKNFLQYWSNSVILVHHTSMFALRLHHFYHTVVFYQCMYDCTP